MYDFNHCSARLQDALAISAHSRGVRAELEAVGAELADAQARLAIADEENAALHHQARSAAPEY